MPAKSTEPVAVAIFAKAPIAGFVKTRLISLLGEEGAAQLQKRLIERTVRVACEASIGPVSLWCSPNVDNEVFHALAERHGVALHQQAVGDLGARMHQTFVVLTRSSPALLLGTDCAMISPRHLSDCAQLLRAGSGAVIVPVEDGGYILIGLRNPALELFTQMPWGSADVMAKTRERAASMRLALTELPPLFDIDRVEDYQRALGEGWLRLED